MLQAMEAGRRAALAALQAELGDVATGEAAARICSRGVADFVQSAAPVSLLDALLRALDRALGAQLDLIYAEPRLRELETRWRGLWLLVQHVDTRQNIRVELLNSSKEDLLADFEDAPDIPKSGLYKQVYSAEYGPFGGRPFALLVADYTIGAADRGLVERLGSVAAMAAMVFALEAGPTLLSQPERWARLRAGRDATHLAMVSGRFAVRGPHPWPAGGERSWSYEEPVDAPRFAPGSLALAITIARSFALWRTPVHLAGSAVGRVSGLPSWDGRTGDQAASHEAIAAAERQGLVLVGETADGEIMVANARSFWSEDGAGDGRDSYETWARGQLTHVLFAARVMHYIKVLQREQIGTWREREDLERELQRWLDEYVGPSDASPHREGEEQVVAALLRDPTDADALAVYADWLEQHGRHAEAALARRGAVTRDAAPEAAVQSRPLASASIRIEDVDGNAGWYRSTLRVTPAWGSGHGEIELLNKLDRE